ncbi:abortive infection family protein [Geobacillus sp. FSL K6-0789]|uniref:Abortive infection protein-like C-terminal domain-containing protein n=1 Tax=Geobacillus stearothermophilus TaxID=1422 RepID=A0A3L7CHH9_GEOSE|nr:abortive infection family protein [Geobacillus stearothermophilus]KMY56593.1 hypothetical protein AA906_15850 [Geobacillus stearothermophilus]RLQ04597.1 hypothetical protein D9549_15890 [Geobacillus stearothermophilus]RLQ04756.1 hypothetical protein D9547_15530 [Geobacillus stearothermophilus]RLQ12793.1 hypothetical protein D9548_15795 [Geobacillus stearothermophilus]
MEKLSPTEINSVVAYIGVHNGYLGNFSYASHAEFYPSYCGLDINPNDYEGTTRERFIKILTEADAYQQSKILRGVLEKYPLEYFEDRFEEGFLNKTEIENKRRLYTKIKGWISQLEGNGLIKVDELDYELVEEVLKQAEILINNHSAASAVDRVHTALHGYLKKICDEAGIVFEKDRPTIQEIFSKLKNEHPCFKVDNDPNFNAIINSISKLLHKLNDIRNNRSFSHLNENILGEPEALFIINCR